MTEVMRGDEDDGGELSSHRIPSPPTHVLIPRPRPFDPCGLNHHRIILGNDFDVHARIHTDTAEGLTYYGERCTIRATERFYEAFAARSCAMDGNDERGPSSGSD